MIRAYLCFLNFVLILIILYTLHAETISPHNLYPRDPEERMYPPHPFSRPRAPLPIMHSREWKLTFPGIKVKGYEDNPDLFNLTATALGWGIAGRAYTSSIHVMELWGLVVGILMI